MRRRGAAWTTCTALCVVVANAVLCSPAAAQDCPAPRLVTAHAWAPPLGRRITVHEGRLSLHDALERVALAAGLRISYSAEGLPLSRSTCMSYDTAAAGDIFTDLLRGTSVVPVAVAADHVVLAPVGTRTDEDPTPRMAANSTPQVYPLDPVTVRANAMVVAPEPAGVARNVIEGSQLDQPFTSSLTQAFNSTVPGLWVWDQSASSVIARYGSMRGASSFGMSAPKIYINGIEVANPLLLTRLSPDAIDRVEVIRGPEGGALYGADAINGVTNIITGFGTITPGAPRTRVRSVMGLASSEFASASLAQDHTVSLRAGTNARSAGLDLALGSVGQFMPGGWTRHATLDGSGRLVGTRTVVTGTLRYFAQQAGTSTSPLLTDVLAARPVGPSPALSAAANSSTLNVREYTAGVRASFAGGAHWTHALVLGVDGYTLDGVADRAMALLSPSDSALLAAGSSALRGTFRLTSTGRFNAGRDVAGALTLTLDHSTLRQQGGVQAFEPGGSTGWTMSNRPMTPRMDEQLGGKPGARAVDEHKYDATSIAAGEDAVNLVRSNTGISAQLNTEWRNRLLLTSGVRLEREMAGLQDSYASLPMVGATWLAAQGPVSLKLRAAWGRGVRWSDTPIRAGGWNDVHEELARFALTPEQQAGVEAGFDLSVAQTLSLGVTRFDQLATGLTQRVAVAVAADASVLPGGTRSMTHELQNVGEIANRGWELQGRVTRRSVSLAGTLSLVDSRVRRLATGYSGDLQAGDRMLAVPARTMSLTAAWSHARWTTALTAYRAADWVNYDRVSLARNFIGGGAPLDQLTGAELRSYWLDYPGITHLRFGLARDIRSGLTLLFSGDNLLNQQVGEPDNITVLPGRTVSVGIRARF